jgi:hypothetical protein
VEIENIELVRRPQNLPKNTISRVFIDFAPDCSMDATKTIGQLCKKETVLEKNKQNFRKKKN